MYEANDMSLPKKDKTFGAESCGHIASEPGIQLEESLKCRVIKTIALYMTFGGLGFNAPILGLTIVHMEYILDTNTHTLAFAFTTHAIGYTVGGIICGMVYDRGNKEFAFSLSVLTESIMTIASGFCGHIAAFLALMSLQGMAMGFIDAAGQSYCVNLWANHRFKDPILQGAHAVWSLAATIGPFVIRPFLVELHSSNSVGDASNNFSDSSNTTTEMEVSYNFSMVTNLYLSSVKPLTESRPPVEQLPGIELVRYAYLTIGLMAFCGGILFYILYFYHCSPVVLKKIPKEFKMGTSLRTKSQKQRGKLLLILFITMLFMFYFLYIYIEGIPLAYFTAFMIKYLDWTVNRATLVMAVFYGMHCIGRVIGVPLSTVLRPRTMVIMNLVLTSIAYILLFFVNSYDWIIWISAFLSGYGMSSTFAAMILWVSETVPITGRIASVLLVGGSFGGMTGPLLVGQLFDTSPMWMVYILFAASLLHIALFALIFILVKKQKQIRSVDVVIEEHEVTNLNNKSDSEVLDVIGTSAGI